MDAIHKDGQQGLEGSYTNTKKEGNGIKFGKDDISHTISKDKTYTIGGENLVMKLKIQIPIQLSMEIKKFQEVTILQKDMKLLVELKRITME